MSIVSENMTRVGRFTSSEIYRLMSNGKRPMTDEELKARPKEGKGSKAKTVPDGPGKAFHNYIEEKRWEARLGRPLNEDASARPLIWGQFIEHRAFRQLGFNYTLTSDETLIHNQIDEWCGTPDGFCEDAVIEIKAPFTLKSFITMYKCHTIKELIKNHKQGLQYYFQCVSNAILMEKDWAELVIYLPYLSEISEIQNETDYFDGDQNKVQWIKYADPLDLPYVKDGSDIKNLHTIRFQVPEQDKLRLTARVELAARLLKA